MTNLNLFNLHYELSILISSKKNSNLSLLNKYTDETSLISNLMSIFETILKEHNCTFRWQKTSLKKKGHLKYVQNRNNVIMKKEMAIAKYQNVSELLYLFIHEIVHLINNHPIDNSITKKQKEVVADTVAKMMISSLNLTNELSSSSLFKELSLSSYSVRWMKNATLSLAKKQLVFSQINSSYIYLEKKINS